MYLFNVSIILEDSIHQEVIAWTKNLVQEYPSEKISLLKMLHSPHEGQTYCLQVVVSTEEEIDEIKKKVVQRIQDYIATHHVEKAFLFDSVMQYISHT